MRRHASCSAQLRCAAAPCGIAAANSNAPGAADTVLQIELSKMKQQTFEAAESCLLGVLEPEEARSSNAKLPPKDPTKDTLGRGNTVTFCPRATAKRYLDFVMSAFRPGITDICMLGRCEQPIAQAGISVSTVPQAARPSGWCRFDPFVNGMGDSQGPAPAAARGTCDAVSQDANVDRQPSNHSVQQQLINHLVIAVAGMLVGSLIASLSGESLVLRHGIRDPIIIAAIIPTGTALIGLASGGIQRRAPLLAHIACGALMFCSFLLSAKAQILLSTPNFLAAKASKLVPTMLVGHLWLQKRYQLHEWAAAALIIFGVVCIQGASLDAGESSTGWLIIIAALSMDGLYSNAQEMMILMFDATVPEISVFSMGAASFFLVIYGAATRANTLTVVYQAWYEQGASVLVTLGGVMAGNVICSVSTLFMLASFGAASTHFTSVLCKALTIVMSMTIFPKPWGLSHIVGMIFILVSVALVALFPNVSVRSATVCVATCPLTPLLTVPTLFGCTECCFILAELPMLAEETYYFCGSPIIHPNRVLIFPKGWLTGALACHWFCYQ